MGEVYRATDTKLGREVAIKVPASFSRDSRLFFLGWATWIRSSPRWIGRPPIILQHFDVSKTILVWDEVTSDPRYASLLKKHGLEK